MANRAYLYSLSNRPESYADRPETISGLSEWAYEVPFSYRLLMSGDPQLCASLIADGLEEDAPGHRTRLYALSSPFEPGFERLARFAAIVRELAGASAGSTAPSAASPVPPAASQGGLLNWLRGLGRDVGAAPVAAPALATNPTPPAPELLRCLDESLAFLQAHRQPQLLLETVELDLMTDSGEAALRASALAERERCLRAGAALDALPTELAVAAAQLQAAVARRLPAPLDALHGLRLDDDFDNRRDRKTECPIGLEWSNVLFFSLWNKAEFEANR